MDTFGHSSFSADRPVRSSMTLVSSAQQRGQVMRTRSGRTSSPHRGHGSRMFGFVDLCSNKEMSASLMVLVRRLLSRYHR